MRGNSSRYIPALNYDWLTFIYDPLLRSAMQKAKFKSHLVQQAKLQSGMRVLDLGCGTGTLTILAKKAAPGTDVTGLDGDPHVGKALRRQSYRPDDYP